LEEIQEEEIPEIEFDDEPPPPKQT